MNVVGVGFFLFCGVALLAYYLVPGRFQWMVLLAASFVFYGSGASFAYLLFTILTTYGASLAICRIQKAADRQTARRRGRPWLIGCLVLNFGLLFTCKVNLLRGGILPLGLSFYLFQSMGYLIDVYRGSVPAERNLGHLALFLSFFPQLIQGPISRAGELLPQLTAPHPFDDRQVSFGLQRCLWGYFKKLVLAQRVAPAVEILKGDGSAPFLLLTTLYALQIYGDFTGGIDIALGLAQAMGIRLPENFCHPFFAKNTAEFWRRWHISLGEWMKNYVFYPISVCGPMRRFSRMARQRLGAFGKRLSVYVATVITWCATGIWHGLTPNFLLWGMMNCAVIILSQEMQPLYAKFHGRFHLKERRWYAAFEALRTFTLMNLIRGADLFPDVGEYFRRIGGIFTPAAVDFAQLGLTGLDWGILLLGCILLLSVSLAQQRWGSLRERLWQGNVPLRYSLTFLLLVATLLMGCYGLGYDAGTFIYGGF